MLPYSLIRRVLFSFPPETAHNLTIQGMKTALSPKSQQDHGDVLSQQICGLIFPNPVGLAAGFDKNAEVFHAALKMGFGFAEAGTVTPLPQNGTPKPRVFRNPETQSVINRMGFPNGGLENFKANVEKNLPKKPGGLLGINIGMNKTQTEPENDYIHLIQELYEYADYFTINISSPNTPGLRNLQNKENLKNLLNGLQKTCASIGSNTPPIFLKLSPDLTKEQQSDIFDSLDSVSVDGLILTNTTLARPDHLNDDFASEAGGLSGAPLKTLSNTIIGNFYKQFGGRIPIIGIGGIMSGADAYEKIRQGASLVQIYTGLIYEGPKLIPAIHRDLIALLKQDGFAHISQAIGANHKTGST